MSILACGTFNYIATVPEHHKDPSIEWPARLAHPFERSGGVLGDQRLVGYNPTLRITGGGATSSPGPQRPSVLRSRITLTAEGMEDASVSSVSFHVDRNLIALAHPGDTLNLVRTDCGGLALSIVREGELVAAVGAVTSVNLGKRFHVMTRDTLFYRALRFVSKALGDDSIPALPVEFRYKWRRRILARGTCGLGDYQVFLWHGPLLSGFTATDESAAILKTTDQIPSFASFSAQLLENDPVELVPWPGD